MSSKKNNGLVLIILSSIVMLPNIGGLLVAFAASSPVPIIFVVVPAIMLVLCSIGLAYGIHLRRSKG